jgi:hypothetical protein
VSAQNLVPNYSFEVIDSCPQLSNGIQYAHGWFNPSLFPSTPDYFNACAGEVPYNGAGYQNPKTGVAYVGIYAYNGHEYAEIQLADSLIGGRQYYVEYYAVLTEMCQDAISNLGAYFSDSALYWNNFTNIPVNPQIENPDSIILSDTMNWMKISGTFTANGGEKYITIGNFRNDSLTQWVQAYAVSSNNYSFAYYLIDDISVNCVNCGVGIAENYKKLFSIFPIPSYSKINITLASTNTNANATATIYNLLGKTILPATILTNKINEVDISFLPNEMYLLEIIQGDHKEIKKLIKM